MLADAIGLIGVIGREDVESLLVDRKRAGGEMVVVEAHHVTAGPGSPGVSGVRGVCTLILMLVS